MKNITICLSLLIVFLSSEMKVAAQSFDSLDINNISAPFHADGYLFLGTPNSFFDAPKGSGKSTISAGSLWIGGIDNGGLLHVAAQTYRQNGSDFFPGPHKDSASNTITEYNHWNQIWKVNKTQIDSFRGWFLNHAAYPGYVIPNVISNWPANPNYAIGEGPCLAPYVDNNGDGVYNPLDGDYPFIKGDQALFFIFNDNDSAHGETGSPKMNIEVHAMAYAFNFPNDTALNNTIFLNYQIYNMSHNTYDSTYIGNWTDLDIGGAGDDYIGCDVRRSAYFGYNSAPTDAVYGTNPPAQAIVFLKGPLINPQDTFYNFQDSVIGNSLGTIPMTNFMNYNNNFSVMGNPEVGRENFNYLRSRWKDSTHATFGGNGHLGTVSENYMFPDSTDIFGWGMNGTPPPFSWSEAQAAILPSDIRGVGASGPFTFHPGEVVCIDYAYVFSRASSGGNLASVVKMKTDIDNIRNFYKNSPDLQACNCSNYSLGFPNQKTPSTSLVNVYPNPFSTTTTLTLQGNYHNPSLLIYNLLGQEVETQCITSLQANGNFQFTIHRNNLPAGMYFYKVMEENKEVIGLGKMVVSE